MLTDASQPEAPSVRMAPLTRNQIRGFWASWGGWTLDGMDSFIYALVLVPSLRDLLPRSGIAATRGNIGYYGGLLFAQFLCGWGLAFLWGPVGDKFGRVRTLMLTIVWYSVFTFLSAWLRMSGNSLFFAFSQASASAASGQWVERSSPKNGRRTAAMRRRTILNALFMLATICGLWAGTVYVPAAVTALAEASWRTGPLAAQIASRATMLVSFATILGCLAMRWLAERLGRRGALGFFFALMAAFIALTFGKVFYLGAPALPWFFVCLFFLGFGGANFAVYTLWLPEQYPTECRASAFAFSTSFARFGGAAITFLVGAGVQRYGSLGIPVALTAIAFAIGLLLIPFGAETRGRPLPA